MKRTSLSYKLAVGKKKIISKCILSFISIFFVLISSYSVSFAQDKIANPAIGKWIDHSSFDQMSALEQDHEGNFYVMSSHGLFFYNTNDHTLEHLSKITGLSDAGYNTIGFSKKKKTLVVGYTNSNIDLVIDGRIYNISGLKDKSMQGDKTIYNISFDEKSSALSKYAYLACGFGILVIDIDKKEIKETYLFGNNGDAIKTNSVAFTDSLIVAATDQGIYYANKNNKFLVNYNNWKKDLNLPNPNAVYKDVFVFNNILFASQDITSKPDTTDSRPLYAVYKSNSEGNWDKFGNFRYCQFSSGDDNTFLINVKDTVYFYDKDLIYQKYFCPSTEMSEVLWRKNTLWAACPWSCFNEYPNLDQNNAGYHCPTGPGNITLKAVCYNDKVYIAPGGRDLHFNPQWNDPNIYTYSNNTWKSLSDRSFLDGNFVTDILDITVDPNNTNHLYAPMWNGGLLEVLDNKVVNLYNETNSTIREHYYSPGRKAETRVPASAFDSKGNLWVLNSMAYPSVCIRYPNGVWDSLETANLIETNIDLAGMILDFFYEYKWIYPRDLRNKIYVVDGNDRQVYIDPNKGSSSAGITDFVTALACDLDGTIWVGTNKGIKAIYNIGDVFTDAVGYESAKKCENIIYEDEDGNPHTLLGGDYITSIAIDGANRKWIGTQNNGVFLLSPDGLKQIYHFTAEETPLPSNSVTSVAVQHQTGIVYFVTDNGIVSYKAEATSPGDENSTVYVYPNPVRPGYEGAIAIKNLMQDAIVKITDLSGNVVFNTKAYGGQAIWYGKNMNGQKVKSGVYLVFASDAEVEEKVVTKILFIK